MAQPLLFLEEANVSDWRALVREAVKRVSVTFGERVQNHISEGRSQFIGQP